MKLKDVKEGRKIKYRRIKGRDVCGGRQTKEASRWRRIRGRDGR